MMIDDEYTIRKTSCMNTTRYFRVNGKYLFTKYFVPIVSCADLRRYYDTTYHESYFRLVSGLSPNWCFVPGPDYWIHVEA